MINVVVADDQALARAGFRSLLDGAADIAVVGEAVNGAEAVGLVAELRPDVVMMDVRMPVMDGLAATRQIVAEFSGVRVLVVTTFDTDDNVYGALRAGASGFVLKDVEPDELLRAIRTVAAGDALIAPSATRRLIEAFHTDDSFGDAGRAPGNDDRLRQLTDRECEILDGIARGWSNQTLAERLFISEATVKTHVSSVLSKLQLRSRVQAVVLAYETGLVRRGAVDLDDFGN
jgi:DNA-binding NarL/FixJ family response regulator